TSRALASTCNAGMITFLKISLQALSTRALFLLKVRHLPSSLAVGFGGGGGGVLIVTRVEPLAEQLPASDVAVTVISILAPGATPVVSSEAFNPSLLIEPAVALHSYRTVP